ncbi:cytochrome c biogenesis protein [Candidatus Walczuchella monophlebidarum]|nr:cytochrome c biogenesis protein CcsA [Candidatus Walczuchella monophlebidarum]
MATGTFLEQVYTTDTAKALIYESSWFETIMILLLLCFIVNIGRYCLWRREKWPLLIFHLAFVLIFIGGAISRYIGFEGMMYLLEGATSKYILSSNTFIKLKISDKNRIRVYEIPYLLANLHSKFQGRFQFGNEIFNLKIINYVPHAQEIIVDSFNGSPFLQIVTLCSKGAKGYVEDSLFSGKTKKIGGQSISFGSHSIPTTMKIVQKKGKLYLLSSVNGKYTIMKTGISGLIRKNVPSELKLKTIYKMGSLQWMVPDPIRHGIIKYVSSPKDQEENFPDAITAEVSNRNQSKIITFFAKKGLSNMGGQLQIENKKITIGYGSIFIETPFSLHLDRFELQRYPGSSSPSSFASELTINDGNDKKKYRILMNNVLSYKGYRFFQSSYDSDIKGTYLSVNHDYWGTMISYIGNMLLGLGMFINFFWKGTHFSKLRRKLAEINRKKFLILIFLPLPFIGISAKHKPFSYNLIEFINSSPKIPNSHLDKFSRLLVQDPSGRIKPIHTMALELLRKIYKKDYIGPWEAVRWMISIYQYPRSWIHLPFIKVGIGNKLLNITKANKNAYTSLMNLCKFNQSTGKIDFFLKKDYEKAFLKSPSQRNQYDKAIIDLTEKIGLISGLLQGEYLRIFPNEVNHTWIRTNPMKVYPPALNMLKNYFIALSKAQQSNYWKSADKILHKIINYQYRFGHDIIPCKHKIEAEIFYNKLNIFYNLIFFYAFLGLLFLIVAFTDLFTSSFSIRIVGRLIMRITVLVFFIHAFGLAFRCYISGHSPWSNGYESAVFISWCIVLVSCLFYRTVNFFLPSISTLSSTALLGIAHMMNPEITNLVPVLKSYWLIIHVAVITSSYGFFSVGGFLGLTVLIICILRPLLKNPTIENLIKELTIINEMSLTIGLFLLTVGTFLGGVWANNSWGRYWSWDPKETWALISIIVYAFVLHMRLIPNLRGIFAFNFASILSFSSIIMTYFGVNYYLSGLHSYAKGNPIAIPIWIYYILFFLFFIAIIARDQIKKFPTNSISI